MMIDFDKLDRTIHEKGRLSIMTLLVARPRWAFQEIKAELGMSDGNLITHLRALEKAGFLAVARETEKSPRPRSVYALTDDGRKAFENYLAILETIVEIGKQT